MALILNVAISAVLTVLFRRIGVKDGYDETRPADYLADPVAAPAASTQTRKPSVPSAR